VDPRDVLPLPVSEGVVEMVSILFTRVRGIEILGNSHGSELSYEPSLAASFSTKPHALHEPIDLLALGRHPGLAVLAG
jgi:hypothetical protein